MEKGRLYVFYNDTYKFVDSNTEDILIGKYVGEHTDNIMIFELEDGSLRFSTRVYDKVNEDLTVEAFISNIGFHIQNATINKSVIVDHNDFEFEVFITRVSLDEAKDLINQVLENWFSAILHELKHYFILERNGVKILFRLHKELELQFRHNSKNAVK